MSIAYDANSGRASSGASSYTLAHTCTGSNLLLTVTVFTNSSTSDVVTGVTYNAVSMTRISTQILVNSTGRAYVYTLPAPSTGANNIVVSLNSSDAIVFFGNSFTGCRQATALDVVAYGSAVAATTVTPAITIVENNAWICSSTYNTNTGTYTAGTNTVKRDSLSTILVSHSWSTSADQTPPGSKSLSMTRAAGNTNWDWIIFSIMPILQTAPNFFQLF